MSSERSFSIPVDLIRTVAIVGVILLHAANDLTVQQMNSFEIFRWTTVDFYQSLGRMGVPLFLLLTGALLLQPSKLNEPIKVFFKKRFARIGLAFVFWGAVYFAWDFFVVHNINNQPINTSSIIQGVLTGPSYQFWYLYLLLGLYLLTPIMRVVITYANRNLLKYLLALWFLGAAVLPVFGLFTTLRLDSNVFEFTGYAGYFILGAFFLTVQMRRSTIAILLSVGVVLTAIGTYVLAWTIGGGTMFFFQGYLSPTLILAAVALFLLLNTFPGSSVCKSAGQAVPAISASSIMQQNYSAPSLGNPAIKNSPEKQSNSTKLMRLISINTLPLYLFHVMVLETFQYGYLGFSINGNTINSIIGVPIMTVLVLFVSLAIILVMKKVPVLDKLIG